MYFNKTNLKLYLSQRPLPKPLASSSFLLLLIAPMAFLIAALELNRQIIRQLTSINLSVSLHLFV